jgi:hypothetical protein
LGIWDDGEISCQVGEKGMEENIKEYKDKLHQGKWGEKKIIIIIIIIILRKKKRR